MDQFLYLQPIPATPQPMSLNTPVMLQLVLINARSSATKTFTLNDFITSYTLGFLFLTETWLISSANSLSLQLYVFSCPRLNGRGGDLSGEPPSFKVVMFKVNCDTPVCCIVIYHPPIFTCNFISDFSDFISSVALSYDKILLVLIFMWMFLQIALLLIFWVFVNLLTWNSIYHFLHMRGPHTGLSNRYGFVC